MFPTWAGAVEPMYWRLGYSGVTTKWANFYFVVIDHGPGPYSGGGGGDGNLTPNLPPRQHYQQQSQRLLFLRGKYLLFYIL